MVKSAVHAGVFASAVLLIGQPADACRLALAFATDVSNSVNAEADAGQRNGLTAALMAPNARAAFFATEDPVAIAVYEWLQPGDARIVLGWTELNDAASLNNSTIGAAQHATLRHGPSTGLGAALIVGFNLLDQQTECWPRTLDISGDGKGNTGQRPQDITQTPFGVTMNGLVIGVDDGRLGAERDVQIGELTA